jgi:hypothetical protein
MATYTVNQQAVARARQLIDARQYVLKSVWGNVQPSAEDENAFLESHSWEEYASWHLALTDGATDETKGRYAFVYDDFRRLHRMGLIACQYRAAEWRTNRSSWPPTTSSSTSTSAAAEPFVGARRALACSSSLSSCRRSLLSLAVASRSRTAAEADQRNPA